MTALRSAVRRPTRSREAFYRAVLARLTEAGVPYLVGGAYGLAIRHRRHPAHQGPRPFHPWRRLRVGPPGVEASGFETEMPFPHWLAKVRHGEHVIDLIFSSGNGQSPVDDTWFAHAFGAQICGVPVRVCPLEETIWTKAFVMERERYDGADVAHLLQAAAERIDWSRLLARFGDDWPCCSAT